MPCGLPYSFARITMRRTGARWRERHAMPTRPGACWRWRRSMTGHPAARRPRSAVSKCSPSTSSGVRDWVLAFNVEGPPGLIDGKAPGNQPLLNIEQREALKQIVEAGPNPAVDGVVRWRLADLAQWVFAEFGISVSKQTLSRILRGMGYRKLTARPRHYAQDPLALEAFKQLRCACGGDRAA